MIDINILEKLEKAISEKYGKEAIRNPSADWTIEKEKKYLEEIKTLNKKTSKIEEYDIIEVNGILIPKKLFRNTNTDRLCLKCSSYSFKREDDLFLTKYKCCQYCYIKLEDLGKLTEWKTSLAKNV